MLAVCFTFNVVFHFRDFSQTKHSDITHRLKNIRGLLDEVGCNVFIVDYRGFGTSTGKPSESGLRIDAEESLAYLRGRADVDVTRIVVFGRSLGGAVAVHLANVAPTEIAGLILENTFTSVPDMVKAFVPMLAPIRHLSRNRWETKAIIGNLRMPMLFMSSLQDEMVPHEHMTELIGLARKSCPFVTVEEFPDGHHMNLIDDPTYYAKLRSWLVSTCGAFPLTPQW